MRRAPLAGPVDLLLTVDTERVRLSAVPSISRPHGGVRPAWPKRSMRRADPGPDRPVLPRRAEHGRGGRGDLSLARAAPAAGGVVLARPVRGRASRCCRRRSRPPAGPAGTGRVAGTGRAAVGSAARPDGRVPLGSASAGRVYRSSAARPVLPGPLRIVVAIAAPDGRRRGVVDYERRTAQRDGRGPLGPAGRRRRRVVPFAALRDPEELDRGPAHVLHISGHGCPGTLALEDERPARGGHRARSSWTEAIPPGRMPPVITLVSLLHRRGGRRGVVLLRRRAGPARRVRGDRHRDLVHRPLRHPAVRPRVRRTSPSPATRT